MKVDSRSALRLAKKLISIDTTNPPGNNYAAMVRLLRSECTRLQLKTRIIHGNRKKEKPNLIAEMKGRTSRTLHITSHYDTVPVTSGWSKGPFRPAVEDGRLYGRGAVDQKALIAAVLSAIDALVRSGRKPGAGIQLSFVCDEESGGEDGLAFLAGTGLLRADWVLGEGSSGRNIAIGSKGVIWADVTVKGRSAHGAIPWTGRNAFTDAMIAAKELQKLGKRISRRKTSYQSRFEKNRYASLVLGGLAEGTGKRNVVPDTFRFSIDRRVIPEESIWRAKQEIDSALKRSGVSYMREWVQVRQPDINMPEDFLALMKAAVAKHYSRPRPVILPGIDDKRHFKGIPRLGYGVDGRNIHGDDEYAFVDSIHKVTGIYADVMSRLG